MTIVKGVIHIIESRECAVTIHKLSKVSPLHFLKYLKLSRERIFSLSNEIVFL